MVQIMNISTNIVHITYTLQLLLLHGTFSAAGVFIALFAHIPFSLFAYHLTYSCEMLI